MKLFKPTWISHDGQPIFSVDIHPDGSRFATAGQGDGGSSGKVIVWNMMPLLDIEVEKDENVPKALCIMDNHQACVNSVRWSCSGRYLASGGDDRLIMIWQFAGYGVVGGFGSNNQNLKTRNGERWRCCHTLKGHTGDVLGLAWSPYDRWLASCSVDNTVVVWDAQKFPEMVHVLRDHTSLVKGVTWDPIGSYIASQADDKTVKIWKTLDWKLEASVSEPFEESHASTHVLRLSWSPDGGYLVSAHAMNNSGPTAQIIERDGWKTGLDFVGHRKAITATRFNNCLFHRIRDGSKSIGDVSDSMLEPYTCCAVGSRDRSLSVWLTSLNRPLVVIHELFNDSVMDMSWSFTGYSMLCCSWDGTLAYLEFNAAELGHSLTQEQKNHFNRKTYGKASFALDKPLVIENPAMLAVQQLNKQQTGVPASQQKNDEHSSNSVYKSPQKYPTKQYEIRTPTGRRRIVPVFVAPQEALGVIPKPFGSDAFKNSLNLSKTVGEEGDDKKLEEATVDDEEIGPPNKSQKEQSNSSRNDSKLEKEIQKNDNASREKEAQKHTNDEDGKTATGGEKLESVDSDGSQQQKRKAGLDARLITKTKQQQQETDDSAAAQTTAATTVTTKEKGKTTTTNHSSKENAAAASALATNTTASGKVRGVKTPSTAGVTAAQRPDASPRRPGRPPLSLKRKLQAAAMGETTTTTGKKSKKNHNNHDAASTFNTPSSSATTTSGRKRAYAGVDDANNSAVIAGSQHPHMVSSTDIDTPLSGMQRRGRVLTLVDRNLLPALKLQTKVWAQTKIREKVVSVSCDNQTVGNTSSDRAYAAANIQASSNNLHKLICRQDDVEKWTAVFSSPFLAVSISKYIVGVACADNTVCALSLTSGRRVLPLLCRSNPIAGLHVCQHKMMVIDATCSVTVWDVKMKDSSICEKSFAHLLPPEASRQATAGATTSSFTSAAAANNQSSTSCLRHYSLTEQGTPLITLTNGRTFAYSTQLSSWTPVSQPDDLLERFSQSSGNLFEPCANEKNHQDGGGASSGFNHLKMIVDSFRARTTNRGVGAHASQSFRGSASSQRDATIAVLEQKINRCETLESPFEYRRWLLAYVRYLVSENLHGRLREVCDDLIGPPFQCCKVTNLKKNVPTWQPHIMGMKKRMLLRDEVLPIVASNLTFQRIYSDYLEQLENMKTFESR